MFEFNRDLVSDRWHRYVSVGVLFNEARVSIFDYLRNRVSFTKFY